MAAAAAIIVRKERDIVNTFRAAGALDAGSARDPFELGIGQRVPFNILVRRRVLRDAGNGRYFLDDARWTVIRGQRRRVAFAVLTVIAVVLAILLVTGVIIFANV